MEDLSPANMNGEGKIKRTKLVVATKECSKCINLQFYIFNQCFKGALLRRHGSERESVNCIIISINIHCYCKLDIAFIYIFFFLLKTSALFHSNKIKALVQQLKLHLADLPTLWQNKMVAVFINLKVIN